MKISRTTIISIFLLIGIPLFFDAVNQGLIWLDNFDAHVEWEPGQYMLKGYPTKLITGYETFRSSYSKIVMTPNSDVEGGYEFTCIKSSIFDKDTPVWKIKEQRDGYSKRLVSLYLLMWDHQDGYTYKVMGCDLNLDYYEGPTLFHAYERKSQFNRPSKFIYLDRQCNLVTEHGTVLTPYKEIQYL